MPIKIASVEFHDSERRYGDKEAIATLTDGSTDIFVTCWFSDELTFHPSEFVGLTVEAAQDLKVKKDIAYLRS